MPLIYSLISKNEIVLAEYTENIGNFPSISRFLLKKIDKKLNKQSYTYDDYCFHFLLCNSEIVYMVMSDRSFGLKVPYEYLIDIKNKTIQYVEKLSSPLTLILNGIVSPMIKEKMNYWNIPEHREYNKLANQLSTIQNVLIDNIDILLERGEKLDLLVSQTKNLALESNSFRRQSQRFHQSNMWLPKKKILIIFILLLGVYLILSFNCNGFLLYSCLFKDGKSKYNNMNNINGELILQEETSIKLTKDDNI
ncbi:synaptobrevin-like proteinhypothetical protein [Cryptosporidium ryanae]|uniref:synaptobrevin-like proteinhypothetical protein n=1 Tax=Cryptosporidium ryanae TaxID=515981 RepID=UPI00351A7F49|nr:synaptobrevin-like proteinhypothetical protein [Cryptosporidium ryanae]